MLDDRRPTSDDLPLPARAMATHATRAKDLRRRREAEPTRLELQALARRVDAERERLTQIGGRPPRVSELAHAAGCDAELLVRVITCPHVAEDRRLDPLAVLLEFARGADPAVIARRHGATAGATARVLRQALQRLR